MAKNILKRSVAILLAAVLFISLALVGIEAGHDCCGDTCSICSGIAWILRTLKSILTAFLAFYTPASLCESTSVPLKYLPSRITNTLITMKVKLTD